MKRLNLNISDATEAQLNDRRDREGVTATEIVRRAISLYWTMRQAVGEGDTLYLRKPDGTYERIHLP